MKITVAVVGASGFVGSSVVDRLVKDGIEVVRVRAPRIVDDNTPDKLRCTQMLADEFRGVHAVVNCSGVATATGRDSSLLFAGNAWSAEVVAAAATRASVGRFVHVSSAAVQGDRVVLDASTADGAFSPYSRSKAEGERRVLEQYPEAVVYRPPGVHAASRSVTKLMVRVASSPFSFVAAPGDYPTPQALSGNVASAIAFLSYSDIVPPRVVIHPSEGLSVSDLMTLLGRRSPVAIPARCARWIVRAIKSLGRIFPVLAANGRRLELLWFGQAQAESWLESQGWEPPFGPLEWGKLGDEVRDSARRNFAN